MPTIISYNKRLEAMRSERSTFLPLWRDLSDYHLSHRGRFLTSDRNKGYKRNTRQLNNTSRLALRTTASGMMSGISSPALPWFELGPDERELNKLTSVKIWTRDVQDIMYRVFAASNTYNSLHQLYAELAAFGTAAMGVFSDFEDVINCRPYTVGSYMLGLSEKNVTDSMYREYELSVGQVIKQFGIENVSESVKRQWEKGNSEAWVKLVHLVEPNDDRDQTSILASDKAFRSVYYESARSTGGDKFLRESGFDEFAILAPRWDVTGEDVYATDCPGITCIGDTKALQLAEKRKYQAIDRLASPPLQGSTALKNAIKGNTLKADQIVWLEAGSMGTGLSTIYGNYRPEIGQIKEEIYTVENRIKRSFYEDLFLMLANSDRRQITAREVAEKHEEKLLMLGPVLERLHTELLSPLIDRTFSILQSNGILPVPPPELQGKELNIRYISVLAQAQRLSNTESIDRMAQFVGGVSGVWPKARHKIDINQSVDDYANSLGINPGIILSNEVANEAAAAEEQAAARAAQMQQGEQVANIAKTASETKLDDNNALAATIEGVNQ